MMVCNSSKLIECFNLRPRAGGDPAGEMSF